MREEVMELKNELEEIKEESFARELLKDMRKANKRQFIVILVILGMWFCTIGYLVYVLNDIGTIEETTENIQEVSDIDSIGGNVINSGDNHGENKADN